MAPTSLTLDRSKQRALPVWLLIAVIALIVARIISGRYAVQKDVDLVNWTPIAEAAAAAKRAHRPIVYEFSAAWCGPCQRLEREVFMNPSLADEINRNFIAVKVVDRHQEDGHNSAEVQGLLDRYGVTGFPTIVVAAADGSVLDRTVGFTDGGKFAAFLFRVH